jgi:hypothetical protein
VRAELHAAGPRRRKTRTILSNAWSRRFNDARALGLSEAWFASKQQRLTGAAAIRPAAGCRHMDRAGGYTVGARRTGHAFVLDKLRRIIQCCCAPITVTAVGRVRVAAAVSNERSGRRLYGEWPLAQINGR